MMKDDVMISVCSWFFYAIHLWFLANKLLYTNQYLQSFDPLKPRLPYADITEETSNHLLSSTAWTNNFCWFRFILKYSNSGLLFTFGLIRIDPCFVPSNAVVDQIWPTSVEFLEHFFAPFNTVFELRSNCVGSNNCKVSVRSSDHAKSYVLLSYQCLRMPESRGMLYAGLAQSFHAQHQH